MDKSNSVFAINNSCIICESNKRKSELTTGEIGRKRIRETAFFRNDNVYERLKSLSESGKLKF